MDERQPHPTGGRKLTKSEFADSLTTSAIVKRHATTGMWDHLNPLQPFYGDLSHATHLAEALELVEQAKHELLELPAAVRTVCRNDPAQLLRMLGDEDQTKLLMDAGLGVTDDGVKFPTEPMRKPEAKPEPVVPTPPTPVPEP